MATPEDEIRDLREKNNELVQKVQHWKMTAAQRENEKLALMKEINELRLKLSRLRNSGGVKARNLDSAIQAASERALAHLVRASGEIAHTIDLAKAYMRDRQELDAASPRWSAISGTPTSERRDRVHRVPPMMMGGQSIQPVVALSRTLFNTNHTRSTPSSPNQNRRMPGRAVPMHMLQDVYIPLTRIDIGDRLSNNMDPEAEAQNTDSSTEDLGLNNSVERVVDESQNMSEDDEFESSRRLDAVTEDMEPEDDVEIPPRSRTDNPLEGPSWLLDSPMESKSNTPKSHVTLEPDSTTEVGEGAGAPPDAGEAPPAFSPTVRRRKRSASPPPRAAPPRPPARRDSSGRILKVMVAKMRLESDEDDSDDEASPPKRLAVEPSPPASPAEEPTPPASPVLGAARTPPGAAASQRSVSVKEEDGMSVGSSPAAPPPPAGRSRGGTPHKRHMRFDAPSPNGATDACVLVVETSAPQRESDATAAVTARTSRRGKRSGRRSRAGSAAGSVVGSVAGSAASAASVASATSSDSRDSDSGGAGDSLTEGRSRRNRKAITYKEKPLNVKMRR